MAQKDIEEIENGLSNSESVLHRTLLNKGEILRLLAASYEVLSINNVSDIPINGIANHIMKRVSQLNTNLSKSWIYDSLPAKYKSHRLNPNSNELEGIYQSGKRTENSSLNSNPEEENNPEIQYYQNQMILCKKIISHLRTEQYLIKTDSNGLPLIDIQEYQSDMIIRKTAQDFLSDTFDNRKTVSVNTIHFLLQAFFSTSNKYAAGVYISKLKEFGIQKKDQSIQTLQKLFTPKQLGKILKGETREIHQSFEIITENDAYENGFYGKAKCSECGDRRVKLEEKYDWKSDSFGEPMLHCYACLSDEPAPKVKLPLSKATPR